MPGMFYSIKEVAEKLSKSEEDVRQLVKSGRLREFRDGPNLLFKVDEVTALMSDTAVSGTQKETPAAPQATPAPQEEEAAEVKLEPEAAGTPQAEADEISLAPEMEIPEKTGEEIQLTDADTQIVDEGIKVLGETDTVSSPKDASSEETFKGLSGTPAAGKEASLEEIEKDVSLDTFGSGSGLLDLSLQADDTSLGGILDEIYTPGSEGKGAPAGAVEESGTGAAAAGAAEGSAMEVAAEADQMLTEAQFPEPQMAAPGAAAFTQAYAEAAPDALSNAMGVMLFIPLLAVIYTAIIAVAGLFDIMPAILKGVQGFIWYIAIGMAVTSGAVMGLGAMMGGEKKPKAPKPPKPPKVKKEKPTKQVKEKKAK